MPQPKRTLIEKLAIVRESRMPGVKTTSVAKRHGIASSVLYYWRKVYGDLAELELSGGNRPVREDPAVADLQLQVRNLERLLGQRTLELELLRECLEGRRTSPGATTNELAMER